MDADDGKRTTPGPIQRHAEQLGAAHAPQEHGQGLLAHPGQGPAGTASHQHRPSLDRPQRQLGQGEEV